MTLYRRLRLNTCVQIGKTFEFTGPAGPVTELLGSKIHKIHKGS